MTSDHTIFQRLATEPQAAPFDVLGIHPTDRPELPGRVIRIFLPWARAVEVLLDGAAVPMKSVHREGGFGLELPEESGFPAYRLRATDGQGEEWEREDPYRLSPVLDEERTQAFLEGRELRAHEVLGATSMRHDGLQGTRFAIWAPHARGVRLCGSMNGWDGRIHPMRPRGRTGVWELFVPGAGPGDLYKYDVCGPDGDWVEKADPFGFAMEIRPASASIVVPPLEFDWTDQDWVARRASTQAPDRPLSIYEVHLGSWRRKKDSSGPGWLSYRELADQLLPYV